MSDKKSANPYRAIIEHMIEMDEGCGSPGCPMTMMGHSLVKLAGAIDLIKELDHTANRTEIRHRFERDLISGASTTIGPNTRLELQPKDRPEETR
jgi:hypothetical protein